MNKNVPGTFNTQMWIFGKKLMYCLFECFPSDFSECFFLLSFFKGQDTSLVYTVYFHWKLIVEVSRCPHVHVSIPLFSHRYTILTRDMATQNKDYISRLPCRQVWHVTKSWPHKGSRSNNITSHIMPFRVVTPFHFLLFPLVGRLFGQGLTQQVLKSQKIKGTQVLSNFVEHGPHNTRKLKLHGTLIPNCHKFPITGV